MKTIFDSITRHIEPIKLFILVVGGLLAYIQYWSANAFKRAQYTSELWRKFYSTKELTQIFQALERKDEAALKEISEADIYLYLGYLEEIVIFSKTNLFQIHKINKNELLNLFQFHFYYVYQLEDTKQMFWTRIIEKDEIENEIKQFYWKKQFDFSVECKKRIES